MSEWPRNWDELTRGIGCEMCEGGRPEANAYGVRIRASRYTDAYLQRADVQRGYKGYGQRAGTPRIARA